MFTNGITSTTPPATKLTDNAAAEYAGSVSMQYLLAYHLFGFIWTKDLLEAIGAFVVASVIVAVFVVDVVLRVVVVTAVSLSPSLSRPWPSSDSPSSSLMPSPASL